MLYISPWYSLFKQFSGSFFSAKLTSGILHVIQPQVAERHFLDLRKKYGSVLAVDLVNEVHTILSHNNDIWLINYTNCSDSFVLMILCT